MAARHPHPAQAFPFRQAHRRRANGKDTPDVPARVGEPDRPGIVRRHGYRGAVLFAASMGVLSVVTWGASAEALRAGGYAIDWLATHDSARGRALATVLSVSAGALALIAAWGRETAERRPVRLADGRARMAVDEIAAVLRTAIVDGAGLADADVLVQNLHRRGLRVTVRADVQPRARIDETVDAVDDVVREIVQQQLGARLAARPAVDVRYEELDLRLGRGT